MIDYSEEEAKERWQIFKTCLIALHRLEYNKPDTYYEKWDFIGKISDYFRIINRVPTQNLTFFLDRFKAFPKKPSDVAEEVSVWIKGH